jgi:acetyl esterase/lipase
MGFSAGGHLAGLVSNREPVALSEPAYADMAKTPCRPDFSILIYGVLPQKPSGRFSQGMYEILKLGDKTPPAFLVHAKNDGVPCAFSVEYAAELKRRGIPCELQLYESGGHGYGLGKNGGEVATWPDRCAAWLGKMGYLKH